MKVSICKFLFSITLFILFFSITSCSQSRVTHVNLTSIEIAPLLKSVSSGTETQLSATAFYDNASKKNVTSEVEWTSSNPSVFNISETGNLTSLAPGSSTISATLDSISATVELSVSTAKLVSLNINPANPEIYVNTQTKLNVIGIYDDKTKVDLTNNVTLTSESESFFTRKNNVITGISAGSASITASFAGKTTTTQVSVKNASLRRIAIDLSSNIFPAGVGIKLRAIGIYSDSGKHNISESVNWTYTTSPSLVITKTDNILSSNINGQITLTASLNGISTSETITISPAVLASLEVLSSHTNIAAGEELQLRAIGHYSDNRTADLTSAVNWSSTNSTIVDISNVINFEGQAISKKSGQVSASAMLGDFVSSIAIEVSSATLNEIDITLQRQDMASGTSLSLVATGIYSDNTSRNITDSVIWSSEDLSIIHVSNEFEHAGLATGLDIGTTRVFASLNNITSNAQITVTAATLVEIYINNLSTEIIKDTLLSLQAIGIFSDGSKQDLTSQVLWTSSRVDIAFVSNNDHNAGQLETLNTGSSTISATFNTTTTSTIIEINDATLTDIYIVPGSLSFAERTSSQLQAIGTLSNGRTQNLSETVNWESSAPNIISVSNTTNEKGLVFGKETGDAIINASFNGISASSTLTIISAPLVSIEVSHQNYHIANDTKLTLSATGVYSNGLHQDITRDVLWQSNNPDVAFVSNAENRRGYVYSLSQGSASISATLSDITGSTNILVNEKTLDGITILFDGSNTLAAGNEITLSAIGNYSDGSTLDISNQVTWQSSDSDACTVSTAENNFGLLSAKTTGSCSITAKLAQKLSTLVFTINDATLQSINITPETASLPKGSSIQLIATGHYSDATTSNISKQVNWNSNNTFTSINNTSSSGGLLHAIDVGESVITASYESISATSTITVNSETLESITISELVTGDFNLGTVKSYIAVATYTDQSTQDVSKQVLWNSSDTNIATASNAIKTAGQVTSISAGTISLNAQLNGIDSNQLTITVIDAPLAPISLSLEATPYIILNDNIDTSTIQLNVQTADRTLNIVDGTEIQLSIINGSGNLSAANIATIDGGASFSFTSLTKGLITIKATITGTEISNYVTLYVTDNFSEIIAKYGFVLGALENDLVVANSQFGLLLLNYANRPFTIEGYRVFNGDNVIAETSSPDVLNNNILGAGGNILVTFTTTEALSNNYVVVYYLVEPITGQQFVIAAGFQLN